MTGHTTGSMNENGEIMKKPSKKLQTILLGTFMIFVIFLINPKLGGIGEGKEESKEISTLEEVLMEIEGIGEVSIYFHHDNNGTSAPLTDYFSLSGTSGKKGSELQGILVIAEGAEDFKLRSELSRILSAVLQLPEHRIVIVEMKKRGSTNENE
ncbi:hypothetical protein MKY41_02990 [Sporosarcina sp. FSL W7-1349]|uniref:hypothetical protein n=1 Tax=Sporosarcina sp. FSL W7-1349 TaxID=2921561 RepID=UPI0030F9DDF6